MGKLRDRMRDDLRLRNYAEGTIERYLGRARKFVARDMRPPDDITRDEVRAYLLHLLNDRGLSASTYRAHRAAIKFLYEVTLGLPFKVERILPPKREKRLPEVLSREEALRLLRSVVSLRHRVILTTMYAAGLRISEACSLGVSDIDSKRMTTRVRQGNGAKDRCVMPSPTLLAMLRKYRLAARPVGFLFPGRSPGSHVTPDAVTRCRGASWPACSRSRDSWSPRASFTSRTRARYGPDIPGT